MSPRRDNSPAVGRRNFLKGATLAGTAAAIAVAPAANAVPTAPAAKLKAALPGPRLIAAETQPPVKDPATQTSSGGDFMVDVIKTLGIDYLAMNCALELPWAARVDHQLRRQQQAGIPHVPARGNRGRDGARLRQDRRQADGRAWCTASSACSTRRWRSTTPSAIACRSIVHRRQHRRRRRARARRRMGAQRQDMARDRARLREVGRPAGLAAAFRRVDGARLQDRDDAADGAGADRARCTTCRKQPIAGRDAAHPAAPPASSAGGRCRRACAKRARCWSPRRIR